MIKRKGDLFGTDAPALGHGVNCQGVMGSGIAVPFKERYPKNYNLYHAACSNKLLQPGEALVTQADGGPAIANIASQAQPGADARYDWAFSGFLDASLQLRALGLNRIAIPLIGCGIGGLEWPGVEYLLKATEIIVPEVEYEVWKL